MSAVATLPFVDTHLHFWDLLDPKLLYDWLQPGPPHPLLGNIDTIKMPLYGSEQFLAESRFHNVKRTIHVQAALGIPDPVEETRWLEGLRERTGVPHGIVAATSLDARDVEHQLDRHADASPGFRGIRDYAEGDYLRNAKWERGFAALGERDLVCCLHLTCEDMEKARDLGRRFPQTALCVDHAGFPMQRDDEFFEHWRRGMRTVAEAESAVVKISGLGMFDNAWTVESIRPWVLACIEAFGVERSFFGTNWPVDRMYSSYGDVLDAYAEVIADFTPGEQMALFSGNAERIFRI